MKRCSLLLLLILLCLVLSGCEENTPAERDNRRETTPSENQSEATPTSSATMTPTPTIAPATATPSPSPSPEPTKAATKWPSKPLIGEVMYTYPNRALLAYAKYVKSLADSADAHGNKIDYRYGLFFLNSDLTPELWVARAFEDSTVKEYELFTYDGTLQRITYAAEMSLEFRYLERESMLTATYGELGSDVFDSVTMISLLNETDSQPFLRCEQKIDSTGRLHYYCEGVEISLETYEKFLAGWEAKPYKSISFKDGLSVLIRSEYGVFYTDSMYQDLYDEYLSMCKKDGLNPFPKGIPDDIIEELAGEWQLRGGYVDGWDWNAAQEGTDAVWIFDPNGNGTYQQLKPALLKPLTYQFTYSPRDMMYPEPWVLEVLVDAKRELYYLISVDGPILTEQQYCEPECYSAVQYYEK